MSERNKNTFWTAAIFISLLVTWFSFRWNWLDFLTYFAVLSLLAGIAYLLTHAPEASPDE